MRCKPTCVRPNPTNAHCATCHQTFGAVSSFDRHRRGGQCIDPETLGMWRDPRGMWRMPGPDPVARGWTAARGAA